MPIRGVIYLLVIVVLVAFFFREPLYAWLEDNVFTKNKKENENKETEE